MGNSRLKGMRGDICQGVCSVCRRRNYGGDVKEQTNWRDKLWGKKFARIDPEI
jgi:hypothetical protein